MPDEIRAVNLWCYEPPKHDKLYGLYLWQSGNKFDVVSLHGARGGQLSMHVWKEGVDKHEADSQFRTLLNQKIRKGYKPIACSVNEVGKTFPKMALEAA